MEVVFNNTPYTSKEDLITNGLEHHTFEGTLECSICREPISSASPLQEGPHAPSLIDQGTQTHLNHGFPPSNLLYSPNSTSTQASTVAPQQERRNASSEPCQTSPSTPPVMRTDHSCSVESAVRISYCSHIFGQRCLLAWLNTDSSPTSNGPRNSCPECNQKLFPTGDTHIRLWEPTLADCLNFADLVERLTGDVECADAIRADPMSESNKTWMREVALETLQGTGLDITAIRQMNIVRVQEDDDDEWEYSDGEDGDEEDGDEEDGDEEDGDEEDGDEEDGDEEDMADVDEEDV